MIAEDDFIQFETFEDSFEIVNLANKLDDSIEVVINSTNLKELLNGLPNEDVKLGFVSDIFNGEGHTSNIGDVRQTLEYNFVISSTA